MLTNEQSEHSAVGTAHHYFTCHQLEQTLGSRIICQPGYSYVWHLSWRPKHLYSFLLPSPLSPLPSPLSHGISGPLREKAESINFYDLASLGSHTALLVPHSIPYMQNFKANPFSKGEVLGSIFCGRSIKQFVDMFQNYQK